MIEITEPPLSDINFFHHKQNQFPIHVFPSRWRKIPATEKLNSFFFRAISERSDKC